jgi:LacI family transcriptional regulator
LTSRVSNSSQIAAPVRHATISDVAKHADVSTGTVSHFLTGARSVRPETRRRIEVAIEATEFRPNRAARSLMSNRTGLVGVLVPDVTNPYFAELIRGAEDELASNGITAVLGNTDNRSAKETSYLTAFSELRLDGLILAPVRQSSLPTIATGIPTVLVDRRVRGWQTDVVLGADREAMALAVAHLIELGHERIALVSGNAKLPTARVRRNAFERELKRRDLEPVSIVDRSTSPGGTLMATVELLAGKRPPTAIVAVNDVLAMEVLSAAAMAGRVVPEDLSVIGHDDIALAALTTPQLTTVAQPAYSMGAASARLLLERLEQPTTPIREELMPSQLVVRESTTQLTLATARSRP